MKKTTILITVVIVGIVLSAGCGKNKVPDNADVSVACVPLEGESVDVSNLRAELHSTATYDNLKFHFDVKGTALSSKGEIKKIKLGRYFLVIWKDVDADLQFSKGDIFGFYPHALDLKGGENLALTVNMYEIK